MAGLNSGRDIPGVGVSDGALLDYLVSLALAGEDWTEPSIERPTMEGWTTPM